MLTNSDAVSTQHFLAICQKNENTTQDTHCVKSFYCTVYTCVHQYDYKLNVAGKTAGMRRFRHYYSFSSNRQKSSRPTVVYAVHRFRQLEIAVQYTLDAVIGRVSYIRISLCYFCFRLKTVSLVSTGVNATFLMHHVTVSLQQSKITLQNNCINNTSITQPTLSFYL